MTESEKMTTFGLSSENLARLLKIDAEKDRTEAESNESNLKADLLGNRLAETLSLEEITVSGSARQTQMAHTIANLAGEPIGTLLLDPSTDLPVIRRIKDYGRKLSESAKSRTEHHVANTLYYAAIATALVYHHQKITSHSDEDLQDYFTRLGGEEWISDSLRSLFVTAAQARTEDTAGG